MSELATSRQVIDQRGRWKWLLVIGGVLVVLGIAGVSVGGLLEFTSVVVFAPFVLASSLIQFVLGLFAETRKQRLLHFVAAGLEAVLGFLILAHPLQQIVSVVALVAIFLIVAGLARLARSVMARGPGRAWIVVTGAIAVLLGISVWIGGPATKAWFVGLCIAIDFVCHGLSWSVLALAERKPVRVPAS